MSLTLCWPSWEQIQYIWPSGLSNIFYLGLWPECGLAHTSLPTPPSFYLHLYTGRLSALTAPETPQCGGLSTTGQCRWQLALHWPWQERGVAGQLLTPPRTPSVAFVRDKLAATSSCLQDTQMCLKPVHAAVQTTLAWALWRGHRAENSLLSPCCPLIRESIHYAH